ncbi:MAG: hypothetical protein K2P81_08170 [Bacteriovoracaceae bacterium]|nr:hypothetical protein [Bacteriovoracaceae bacterium]
MNTEPQNIDEFKRNIRWWLFYIAIQVIAHISLSSVGAFFHFLLDHEISLVEGWLHNNGWELAVASKVLAFWIVYKLLKVRLYQPLRVRDYFGDLWRLPDQRAVVLAFFLNILFWLVAQPVLQTQNQSYWAFHFVSYFGIGLWFLSDFLVASILQDLFPITIKKFENIRIFIYLIGFSLSFRLVVPDYFGTFFVMLLHFCSLLLLSGIRLQNIGNVVVYLALVVSPFAAFFGIDPIWGADFSPFKFQHLPSVPFLLIFWMLSLAYYRYRHRWRWPFSLG